MLNNCIIICSLYILYPASQQRIRGTENGSVFIEKDYLLKCLAMSLLGLGIDSDVPIRFRFTSSRFDSILDFLITFSEYSFNTKAIDISKKN